MGPDTESSQSRIVDIVDCGAVSEITRGSPYHFLTLEMGSPPFIYFCPYC